MLLSRTGPLLIPQKFRETKDPCPVFDGKIWHIYGSGGDTKSEKWQIFHATAPTIDGPWTECEPAKIAVKGPQVAAPGVLFDEEENIFHMFVQTHCFLPGGTIEHLISSDGNRFNSMGTVLSSIPKTREAGIYDPHPAIIIHDDGVREYYLTYSGYPDGETERKRTDIYLAKSVGESWYGPWERVGVIVKQEDIPHHNQSDHEDYEWGMEGAQLIQLPNKKIILNAVCYLPEGVRGIRQRVFFAIADAVTGPYKTLGPILDPDSNSWDSAENGHATALLYEDKLHLFYQARAVGGPWRYGRATFDPTRIS